MKHRARGLWASINRRLSRIRRKLYLMIPEWIRERDFELFTAVLCFLAGIPLLITGQAQAGSMEEALPSWVVMGWATVLIVAPILVVAGVWGAHKRELPAAVPWLRYEASGLRLLAYAGYLYGTIISLIVGGDAGATPYIVFIFALTCHSRAAYLTIKVEDYFILLQTVGERPQ